MSLNGKVAIVTGGNSGIGKAIALGLGKAGANIVIDYIADPDATTALEREIVALGDKAMGVEADVARIGDLQKLVDAAVATFGRVDIMVNNAGVETRTSVLDIAASRAVRVVRHPRVGAPVVMLTMTTSMKLPSLAAALPSARASVAGLMFGQ